SENRSRGNKDRYIAESSLWVEPSASGSRRGATAQVSVSSWGRFQPRTATASSARGPVRTGVPCARALDRAQGRSLNFATADPKFADRKISGNNAGVHRMATIEIHVPDELRRRMDEAGNEDWSQIARQAFERHLHGLATR